MRSDKVIGPLSSGAISAARRRSITSTEGRAGQSALAYTANPVVTGFTLPKLLWVRDNEPRNFERVRKVLLPKDYVRFKLTGEYATEVSDASGTSLFDVVNGAGPMTCAMRWGSIAACCPTCYESVEVSGKLTRRRRRISRACSPEHRWSAEAAIRPPAPSATASSNRASSPARSALPASCSPTWMNRTTIRKGRVHTFCHAVPGKWHVMGVTQGAGLSLQWIRNQLTPGADYDRLTNEAATAEPGSQGLYWLPYLMGERTPHLDATARAAWVGLTAKHTRADLIRSVIEGVCYSQKDGLDIIEEMGVPVAFGPVIRRRSAKPVLAAD